MQESYELLFREFAQDFEARLPQTAYLLYSLKDAFSPQFACYAAFILYYLESQHADLDAKPVAAFDRTDFADFAFFQLAATTGDFTLFASFDHLLTTFQTETAQARTF